GMPEAVFTIHRQFFTEVLPVIDADRPGIGQSVPVPASSAKATSETTATPHAPRAATAGIEVKQAGVYIVQVGEHRKLYAFLKLSVGAGHLIPVLGATSHPEITEVTRIALRSYL